MIYNPSAGLAPRVEVFMSTSVSQQLARIGKSVSIKGELSGDEDIYVDGQIDGSIQLKGNSLSIGPEGRVHANITARNVSVSGSLEGNLQISERTDMRKTAVVTGDVQTRRIAIEEGAYFKGKLEILTDSKPQASAGTVAAAASGAPSHSAPASAESTK
jgi:cytoskeletal protein CcmA (bactofilin family)